MLDYINDFFSVIKGFVLLLFDLEFLPNVSIGSVFFISLFFYLIAVAFWPRS